MRAESKYIRECSCCLLYTSQLSGGIFDLYEIVPGFVFGLLAIVVVSLLTPAPTKAVTDEFDSYHHCVE